MGLEPSPSPGWRPEARRPMILYTLQIILYTASMKIGIFDSGLGGLFTMHAIVTALPEYDYVYFGDTIHLPYGDRSEKEIYTFLKNAVAYLFQKDCALVLVACNTASARALRRIQQEYLPAHFPDRRVLGVIVPNIEEALHAKKVGILATRATIKSNTYPIEFKKIYPRTRVFQEAAPLLVPMIEAGAYTTITPVLTKYLAPLLKKNIDTLILACTHYPIIKKEIRDLVSTDVHVICQDEFISKKLKSYLTRHLEIKSKLSKKKTRKFLVTKKTKHFESLARKWFGRNIHLELVKLSS